jgi:cadmium resistance protein CadD (predicted permease)
VPILAIVLGGVAAFVGTMIDNFFAYAAQLALTDPSRYPRARRGETLGVFTLIIIAMSVGQLFAQFSTRWIGLLALGPLALAHHAWRHRNDEQPVAHQRGAVTTFLITVSLGGDNLAVWIPQLGQHGWRGAALTALIFMLLNVVFVRLAQWVATLPGVVAQGQRIARVTIPVIYILLSALIVWESGLF